ncbi:TPA_asm: hypothetical protein [Hydra MELD virus]|nr:TPA_asm: hypothetical protein [Hydra MELD virus]
MECENVYETAKQIKFTQLAGGTLYLVDFENEEIKELQYTKCSIRLVLQINFKLCKANYIPKIEPITILIPWMLRSNIKNVESKRFYYFLYRSAVKEDATDKSFNVSKGEKHHDTLFRVEKKGHPLCKTFFNDLLPHCVTLQNNGNEWAQAFNKKPAQTFIADSIDVVVNKAEDEYFYSEDERLFASKFSEISTIMKKNKKKSSATANFKGIAKKLTDDDKDAVEKGNDSEEVGVEVVLDPKPAKKKKITRLFEGKEDNEDKKEPSKPPKKMKVCDIDDGE